MNDVRLSVSKEVEKVCSCAAAVLCGRLIPDGVKPTSVVIVNSFHARHPCAFSALTLLVGWPVKMSGGCWRGYLSGARCRLAYGPADATATHCLLLQ